MTFTLQLLVSIITLAAVYFNGHKSIIGPRFGVVANMLWWALTIHQELWGLVPFQMAMTYMSWRMLVLWEREHRAGR